MPSWDVTAVSQRFSEDLRGWHSKSKLDLQMWSLSTSSRCLEWYIEWYMMDNKSEFNQQLTEFRTSMSWLNVTKLLPWWQHQKSLVHKCKVILCMLKVQKSTFYFFFRNLLFRIKIDSTDVQTNKQFFWLNIVKAGSVTKLQIQAEATRMRQQLFRSNIIPDL